MILVVVKKYKLIEHTSPLELAKRVQTHLDKGFTLWGQLAVRGEKLVQAVVVKDWK